MALRGTASGYASTGASVTVTASGIGILSGDIVVLCIAAGGGSGQTITFPTGFTAISGLTNALGNNTTAVAIKTAGGSEPSSYTVTPTDNDFHTLQCRVYSGRSGVVTAVAQTNRNFGTSNPQTLALTGITAATGDDIIVFDLLEGVSTTGTWGSTASSGFANGVTSTANFNYQPAIGGYDLVNATAGATGTIAGTATAPTGNNPAFGGYVFSLAAGSGGSGVNVTLTGQSITSTLAAIGSANALALTAQTITSSLSAITAGNSKALTAQSITSSLSAIKAGNSLGLSSNTATFSAAAIAGNLGLPLNAETATFTQGSISASAGSNITLTLTGITSTFSQAAISAANALTLIAESATFAPGALTGNQTYTLSPQTGTFSEAAITAGTTSGVNATLGAQSATFTLAGVTASISGGSITIPLNPLQATFSTSGITASGGAVVVTSTGAGRRTRAVYFITIDGVRFECGSVQEALRLLDQAKVTARKLAEDQAMWAVTEQQSHSMPIKVEKIQPPKIEVSSRDLRAAVSQTRREIAQIYERELAQAEISMLMELSKRQSDDDETIMFLM